MRPAAPALVLVTRLPHDNLPVGADWPGVKSGVQYGHYRSYTLALAPAMELQSEL